MRTWIVKFAYSGSNKREFFEKEFIEPDNKSIDSVVHEYVQDQNRGEAKSDRISYWSRKIKI